MGQEMDLLYVRDVADMLRRSPDQIRWMRHNGTGPRSALVGGRVTFRRADVVAWVESEFAAEDARNAERHSGGDAA